jgi:hypothetical protein
LSLEANEIFSGYSSKTLVCCSGLKAHLAVGTSSKYILKYYLLSGSLNDEKDATI